MFKMASVLSRSIGSKLLLKQSSKTILKQSFSSYSRNKSMAIGGSLLLGGAGTIGAIAFSRAAHASDEEIHSPSYPWEHNGILTTLDTASVRRGYQVYRQVCAACHGLEYMAFRKLVGVTHTEEEMKEIAAEYSVIDGPDDRGKMFKRPGKLFDYIQSPYANEEEARAANNGALPPDLTYIVLGRHGDEDYIFSLLTGYYEAPAGVTIAEEQHFNAYFPGQAIGMAQALYNEIIEYEDGTPATQSQLAKDVSTFLRFTSECHHNERKFMGFKLLTFSAIFFPLVWLLKKRVFTMLKSTKIAHKK